MITYTLNPGVPESVLEKNKPALEEWVRENASQEWSKPVAVSTQASPRFVRSRGVIVVLSAEPLGRVGKIFGRYCYVADLKLAEPRCLDKKHPAYGQHNGPGCECGVLATKELR